MRVRVSPHPPNPNPNPNPTLPRRYCPGHTLLFPGHEYSLSILPQYLSGGMPLPETAAAFAKLCSSIWRAHQLRARALPLPTAPPLLLTRYP